MNTTFQLNDLTEEIFGHLCNVALSKCSDKIEKKRAGCGGRAMRKRVLIKNFVSDLFKMPKKPNSRETSVSSDEEFEDYEMADMSFYEDEEMDMSGYSNQLSRDCWLGQSDLYRNEAGYYEGPYGYESTSSNSYSIYDVYSTVSEQANEGGMPGPSDPLASISSIMHPSEPVGYEMFNGNGADAQYFPTDDYFMTAGQMDQYVSPTEEETHELTDLDASTGEIQSNKNKRRSTEIFDDFNIAFQKRIKI